MDLHIGLPEASRRAFWAGLYARRRLLSEHLAPFAAAQITGDQINFYFGDWHNATPRTIRGSLVERDILTRGDATHPTVKGGVLRYVTSYTYATLAPNASASPK